MAVNILNVLGFDPSISKLENGRARGIQTPDQAGRNRRLCSLSYSPKMVWVTGLEPAA